MELKIFSGKANLGLAEEVGVYLGKPLGKVELKRFADGEIWVKYCENIRGTDVFIIQPTHPPAENLMELLIMIDAAKRSSASRITAVIPFFGYARQDRKSQPREPITAKLVANLLVAAGANRILTMDLHAAQIQGFFDIPVDHLYAKPVFLKLFQGEEVLEKISPLVIVAPDVGAGPLANSYSKRLNSEIAIIYKRHPEHDEVEVLEVVGDVEGRNVLFVDDEINTGGTLTKGASVLKERGARNIFALVTHAVFAEKAIQRIKESPIARMLVTNTIPLPPEKRIDKIRVLSVAELFGEAIRRIHKGESVSSLFD